MKYCYLLNISLLIFPLCGLMAAEPTDTTEWRNYKLQEVDVYGKKHDFGVRSSQMSAISITGAEIKATPVMMGEVDVLKSLQTLPGVQQGGDGKTALFVRGGNADQNLILVDGVPLYNSDHLGGYLSAINPDLVGDVAMYKGAFPARYGARLSSVIDVSMREGDMHNYHANLSLGMIASHMQVEGPILKGRTSFNFGARASYFDLIMKPLYKHYTDKPEEMRPFNKMDYYDLSAKIVHRFSPQSWLSAFAYYGHDVYNSAPTESSANQKKEYDGYTIRLDKIPYRFTEERFKRSNTENSWSNLLIGLKYEQKLSKNINFDISARMSSQRYKYIESNFETKHQQLLPGWNASDGYTYYSNEYEMDYQYHNDYALGYHSDIDDYTISALFNYKPTAKHDIEWGASASLQRLNPAVDAYRDFFVKYDTDSTELESKVDNINRFVSNWQNVASFAAYISDDWAICHALQANVGLRYVLTSVSGKVYNDIEPRISLRWLLPHDKVSIKASYSRMTQALRVLTSQDIVSKSEIWVPTTKNVAPMKSNQYAAGVNYEIMPGLDFSVEGYYKTMDNLLEYRDGASYLTNANGWEAMVVQGRGKSYGIEALLQKTLGTTTGRMSYTWSKSLRKFDRRGEELEAGQDFFAPNDRRHSANLMVTQQLGKHWSLSASWSYMTGRRGTMVTHTLFGGLQTEYDSYGTWFSSDYNVPKGLFYGPDSNRPDADFFFKYIRYSSYPKRNSYILPAVHHLDVSINYSVKTGRFSHEANFSVYNLYNRSNISRVYMGFDELGHRVLKGVCNFPIMPSFSYSLKF